MSIASSLTALEPRNGLQTAEAEAIQTAIEQGELKHVAIIMDGNRRWAKENHHLTTRGHLYGYKAFKAIVEHCNDLKLPCLTVYAFSTENWKRTPSEVMYLMGLMHRMLSKEINILLDKNVRFKVIGDYHAFPQRIVDVCEDAMRRSEHHTGLTLQVALNYGGRAELLRATQQIAQAVLEGKLSPETITEETITQALYSAGLPDPDLIIRTGGENRLSNFLMWQSAYSELFHTPTYWPDFSPEHFNSALQNYLNRSRRFGQ